MTGLSTFSAAIRRDHESRKHGCEPKQRKYSTIGSAGNWFKKQIGSSLAYLTNIRQIKRMLEGLYKVQYNIRFGQYTVIYTNRTVKTATKTQILRLLKCRNLSFG